MATEVDQLVTTLNIASRRVVGELDTVLAPLGLTASNYYFILKVAMADEMTQDQLFKQIYLSHSNVTRRLDQLIGQGLIEKQHDPNDGRGWLIRLTQGGKALVPKIEQLFEQTNATIFKGLSAEQQVMLMTLLTQVNDNLSD